MVLKEVVAVLGTHKLFLTSRSEDLCDLVPLGR